MKTKSVNNPEDYTFKMYDACIVKNCGNPTCWFLGLSLGLGMCDKHFKELEKQKANK